MAPTHDGATKALSVLGGFFPGSEELIQSTRPKLDKVALMPPCLFISFSEREFRLAFHRFQRSVAQFDFYSGNQIGTRAGAGKRGVVRDENGGPVYIKNFDWGPLGGFSSVDISAGYQFNEMLSAGINVSNLLNTKQLEFVGSPSIGRLISWSLK